MTKRFPLALLAIAFALPVFAADTPSEKELAQAKEELQKLSEFVGKWKTNGEGSVEGKKTIWKETWEWSWKFAKDGDSSLAAKITDSKFFQEGTIRYDLKAKNYAVKLKDAKGDEQDYAGVLDKKGNFVMTRTDEKSSDVHTVKLSTAASGIRLNFNYEVQTGGKGLASTVYKANGNKDGESLGGGAKKPECIVTGGAATIKVNIKGVDYWVCCSGCADELKDHPEKYINKKK